MVQPLNIKHPRPMRFGQLSAPSSTRRSRSKGALPAALTDDTPAARLSPSAGGAASTRAGRIGGRLGESARWRGDRAHKRMTEQELRALIRESIAKHLVAGAAARRRVRRRAYRQPRCCRRARRRRRWRVPHRTGRSLQSLRLLFVLRTRPMSCACHSQTPRGDREARSAATVDLYPATRSTPELRARRRQGRAVSRSPIRSIGR